ncbi:MAG: hypothetical protein E7664_03180 [Ruminococcaceae bacterium]|nr:hypothetical protein [Oscillospiraceae bacterium]
MMGLLIPAMVGVLCIVLGIGNMRGNLSSLHSYHRHRVSEEDRLPFGRLVGLGTVTVGASIVILDIAMVISLYTGNQVFTVIGAVVAVLGIAVGLSISFYAMKKYNKGIF